MADNAGTSVLAFRDTRWNSWRWKPILERWGYLPVFINPDLLKTSAFLVESETGDLVSTAFFVKMPLGKPDVPDGFANYIVTTRHSLKRAPLSIRLNKKQGGIHDEPTNLEDWDDNTYPLTDLAILPVAFSLLGFDVQYVYPFDMVRDKHHLIRVKETPDSKTLKHRYGEGDEVFSVGLFPGHPGDNTIHPAARFGNIALIPAESEMIMADLGEVDPVSRQSQYNPIEAFLVEISAMRGQSGSPVFLRPWVDQEARGENRPISEFNFLIGMIQGFYTVDVDARIQQRKLTLKVDAGMGIVIPSRIIYDTLLEDRFMKQRDRELQRLKEDRRAQRPTPTPASIPKNKEPITKESFTEALERASRKVSESESEENR